MNKCNHLLAGVFILDINLEINPLNLHDIVNNFQQYEINLVFQLGYWRKCFVNSMPREYIKLSGQVPTVNRQFRASDIGRFVGCQKKNAISHFDLLPHPQHWTFGVADHSNSL